MSGSTIGGVVGAFVGFFVGAPQLGFMIGSALGGYIAPDKVYGPRLTDAQTQTSQVGVPLAFGYGTFACKGTIIWADKRKERKKKKRAGKGGGPTQVTYTYSRSYAIAICEGSIKAIRTIKRNGKVVYEASANAAGEYTGDTSGLTAASRKFLQKCKIYLGDETQLPDPTIEAVEGVGNVAPFRGTAYVVIKDDDLTDLAGAVPQYEFVVVMDGEDGETEGEYEAPGFGLGGMFPWKTGSVGQREPRRPYITYQYGNGNTDTWFDTLEEALQDIADYTGYSSISGYTLRGWSRQLQFTDSNWYGPQFATNGTWNPAVNDPNKILGVTPAGAARLSLTFSRYSYGSEHPYSVDSSATLEATKGGWYPHNISNTGSAVWVPVGMAPSGYNRTTSFGPGQPVYAVYHDVIVAVRAVPTCEGNTPEATPVPDAPGYYVFADGSVVFHGECTDLAGTYKQLGRAIIGSGGPYSSLPQGPVLDPSDPNYSNMSFWQSAYNAAVAAGKIQSGWVYSSGGSTSAGFYPQLVTTACQCESPLQTVARNRVSLSSIVADLCLRSGIPASRFDVSQLVDMVDGFVVATIGGADSFIEPLSQAYFFDAAEWDAKLRFIKRGGASVFNLTADDLAERDGDSIEETRVQEVELLRKTTVAYVDPVAGFSPATQVAQRRAATVAAQGESAIELPVAMTASDAAKVVDKRIKVAWGEPSKFKYELPYRFSYITPTDTGYITDKAGLVHRVRVMESEEDSGKLVVESSQDEQSAYVSNAAGIEPTPPEVTNPGVIGGTLLELLNIAVLRDEHDQLGIYVAAAGQLPGWRGADVQISTNGGANWDSFVEITEAATIGYTLTALAATVADYPAEQTIDVFLPDAPESVDYTTLLRFYNRAVIGDEIIQYQTVTDLGSNNYRLSGLIRNRYDSIPTAHAAGVRFVLLDSSVVFVQAQQWMLGQTLQFRAVSFGTSEDAYQGQPYTFATAASQTEWKPTMVRAQDIGADIVVTWLGRGRLGTPSNAYHSQHFRGYRVTYTNGSNVVTHDVTGTTDTLVGGASLPGVVTITIAGLNAITGPGTPSESISA
ncbi:phage tail protein [Lysobacter antibioticus]|uniref:phage tail protein n=1 Tax=Lysobacter antibioticus TaxID=84531 RepID=UPI000347E0D7|nr:phage tail protein [Lysobacter antibioticus]